MRIKNFEQLSRAPLRKQALLIAEAGLEGINTAHAVARVLQYNRMKDELTVHGSKQSLAPFRRVVVVGFGKVSFEAVEAIQEVLGARLSCGFVIDLKEGDLGNHIVCKIGTHPLPTVVNVQATTELVRMLEECTEQDLVICVVSGGGSSLLCSPVDMTCETESEIIKILMRCGATITEINTVRKHISQVKGGQLAKICYPATMINLIFSDVPDGDMSMVASGPTVLDTTTIEDASKVLEKYDVLKICQLPSCKLIETPKEAKYFEKVKNILAVSSSTALIAMEAKARDLGFRVSIADTAFEGEAKVLGPKFASVVQKGECVLAAGESTVKVTGKGIGGRNQEMALVALSHLPEDVVFVALASDGYDNTPAAGAIVDSSTLIRAKEKQLDPAVYLNENNSYTFFQEIGDYIDTGITGSNVADLVIILRN